MTILLIAPRVDEATIYSNKWASEVKDVIVSENYPLTYLGDGEVKREDVENTIKVQNPDLIVFYNHGNEDCWYGSLEEKIIDLDNVDLLKGKEVYTMSCLSAKKLGVEAWKRGCSVYIGYKDVFSFNTDEEDLFKEAANSGIIKKIKDKVSWKEAFEYMKQKFNECIEKAQNFWTKTWLAWDRDNLVKYDKEQYPETKCMFRKLAIKLFGKEMGWKISLTLFWHIFLGMLSGIFASIEILIFPVISFLISLFFLVYEITEKESEQETTKDILQFFIGLFYGRLIYIIASFIW